MVVTSRRMNGIVSSKTMGGWKHDPFRTSLTFVQNAEYVFNVSQKVPQ
jgi:hypothetical protein